MDKTVASADEALADLPEGATLMAGGFGLCGIPENLIRAIAKKGTRGLTIVSNNCGIDGKGLGILLAAGQVRKMISSYVGENKTFERLYLEGKLEVELVPPGHARRAPHPRGRRMHPGVLHGDHGFGTRRRRGQGRRANSADRHVRDRDVRCALTFAIVKAWKGDRFGNIVYRKRAATATR